VKHKDLLPQHFLHQVRYEVQHHLPSQEWSGDRSSNRPQCLDKCATQHHKTVNLQQQSRQQNYLHPANARFIDLIKGTKGERQRLEITENQVKAPEKLQPHHQRSVLTTQHSPVCHLFYSSCRECYLRRKESFLLKRSPCQEVWYAQRKRSHIHAEASFGQLSLLQQAHVRGLYIPPLCSYGVCHRTHNFYHAPGSRLLSLRVSASELKRNL